MNTHPVNLLGLPRADMENWFAEIGEKPYRASQVLKWIYHSGHQDFREMSNLSKALRRRLEDLAEIRAPEQVTCKVSEDGTHKWMLRLDAGNSVETVFIPEGDRGTLCVSTQVGCPLDCAFCSTARQGFNRNLSAAEIVGQVWFALRELQGLGGERRPITNVVLMGMGEPLLNFEHTVKAMELMMDDLALGLARRRITLSTAGVVPAMDRLAGRCPVSLAVSLHAPDDALRDRLVPLNRKYPLRELMAACRRYAGNGPREKITFEYVMLDGVNDSVAHARALVRLLREVPSKVNLIPFNPFPQAEFRRSTGDAIEAFREVLMKAGLMTLTRKTRGDDIDAACGQLVGRVMDRTRRGRNTHSGPTGERVAH